MRPQNSTKKPSFAIFRPIARSQNRTLSFFFISPFLASMPASYSTKESIAQRAIADRIRLAIIAALVHAFAAVLFGLYIYNMLPMVHLGPSGPFSATEEDNFTTSTMIDKTSEAVDDGVVPNSKPDDVSFPSDPTYHEASIDAKRNDRQEIGTSFNANRRPRRYHEDELGIGEYDDRPDSPSVTEFSGRHPLQRRHHHRGGGGHGKQRQANRKYVPRTIRWRNSRARKDRGADEEDTIPQHRHEHMLAPDSHDVQYSHGHSDPHPHALHERHEFDEVAAHKHHSHHRQYFPESMAGDEQHYHSSAHERGQHRHHGHHQHRYYQASPQRADDRTNIRRHGVSRSIDILRRKEDNRRSHKHGVHQSYY